MNVQLNIVTCPTYPYKVTRDNVVALTGLLATVMSHCLNGTIPGYLSSSNMISQRLIFEQPLGVRQELGLTLSLIQRRIVGGIKQ